VYGGKRGVSEAVGVLCDASLKWDEGVYLVAKSEESPRRGDGKVVEKPSLGLSNL